jgi:hypothetical protein
MLLFAVETSAFRRDVEDFANIISTALIHVEDDNLRTMLAARLHRARLSSTEARKGKLTGSVHLSGHRGRD